MLTYLLALVNPESGQQVLTVTFLTSVDWSPLCSALISWLTFSWLLSPTDCSVLSPSTDSYLLTDSFSWLQPSVDCSLQPTVSETFLLSSSSGFVRDLAHKPFRAKTDKGILWLAPTHTHTTNAHHQVTYLALLSWIVYELRGAVFGVLLPKCVQNFKQSSVGKGCRIQRLHLSGGIRPNPLTSILHMTLNNQMVRCQ